MATPLPAPRLQLRWVAGDASCHWLCHYELVLPLRDGDIRREVTADDGEPLADVSELVVAMSAEPTKRDSCLDNLPCSLQDGSRWCDPPYRDGAHAQWDSAALGGLPMYVIAPDGVAFKMET